MSLVYLDENKIEFLREKFLVTPRPFISPHEILRQAYLSSHKDDGWHGVNRFLHLQIISREFETSVKLISSYCIALYRVWKEWYGEWAVTKSTPQHQVAKSSSFCTWLKNQSSVGSVSFFSLVGAASDPDHSTGHPKWSHHEHPDVLLLPGVHHQEAGQGRHGDCCLHPEHPRGAGRGGPLHLPQ